MSSQFAAVLGRPEIKVAPISKLKTVRRRYRLKGKFTSLKAVPLDWVLEWGTPDVDLPAAVLDDQFVSPEAEGNPDTETTILTRVYEEATETPQEIRVPEFGLDENGRRTSKRTYRVLKSVEQDVKEGTPGAAIDPTYETLVHENSQWADGNAVTTIIRNFIEATDTLTQIGGDKLDYEMAGLERLTRTFIGLTSAPHGGLTVGQTTLNPSGTLHERRILGVLQVVPTKATKMVVAQYLQPGVLSKSRSAGPSSLPGIVQHQWQTWVADARDPQDMTGMDGGSSIPGVVTSIGTTNIQGFKVRTFSSVAGPNDSDPFGTLAEFNDLRRIKRFGTIEVKVQAFPDGHIPYLEVKPARSGEVRARVVVTLTLEPPVVTAPTAFNLDDLAVQLVTISRSVRFGGQATTAGGSQTVTATAVQAQIRHQQFPEHVFIQSAANGTEYEYQYESGVVTSSGGSIVETVLNHDFMRHTLSGSAKPADPQDGDLIAFDIQPISLSADGGTVYRTTYLYYKP